MFHDCFLRSSTIYCYFIGKQIFHFWFCEQRGDNKGGIRPSFCELMLTKQFHKCGHLHFHTHAFVLPLVKKRKWKGIQFNSVQLRPGWGCWEGWLMGLFYTSMLTLNILHIAKTEIWFFRIKWGCLGWGKELIYFISLMYYLCQYLISFLETQNDGYWEQDGDAWGDGFIYLLSLMYYRVKI